MDHHRTEQPALKRRGRVSHAVAVLTGATVVAAAVLALGVALQQRGLFSPEDRRVLTAAPVREPQQQEGPPPTEQPQPPAPAPQAADPTRVRIPVLGVDASTIPLGIRSDGKIEVPQDYQQTGWWRDGPEPGEAGPAVILGHVDSYEGPAVFYGLETLSLGDPIHIDRLDGSTVTFVVDRIEQHPKDAFPTEAVYGPTDESELRLVTCGGTFDRDARSYRDNVIVFAVATS